MFAKAIVRENSETGGHFPKQQQQQRPNQHHHESLMKGEEVSTYEFASASLGSIAGK